MCKKNDFIPSRSRLCNDSSLCFFVVFLSILTAPSESFAMLQRQSLRSAIGRHPAAPPTASSWSSAPSSLLNCQVKNRSGRKCATAALQAIPALAALDLFFQSSPYTAGAITCGVKASTADLVAQKKQESCSNDKDVSTKPKKADLKRNIAFTIYGALYQGMALEYIYNQLYIVPKHLWCRYQHECGSFQGCL